MATLHVRDVPERLYDRIKRLAQTQNRSLSAEVTTLLDRAVCAEEERQSQAELLAEINRVRQGRRWSPDWPGSTDLLREDRAR
jgi:plasmid stability protein